MARDFFVFRPFAVTFTVPIDLPEAESRERLGLLLRLKEETGGLLDDVLELTIEPHRLRFRFLLEDKGTVEGQLDAIELALMALGFRGRDGWEP